MSVEIPGTSFVGWNPYAMLASTGRDQRKADADWGEKNIPLLLKVFSLPSSGRVNGYVITGKRLAFFISPITIF